MESICQIRNYLKSLESLLKKKKKLNEIHDFDLEIHGDC